LSRMVSERPFTASHNRIVLSSELDTRISLPANHLTLKTASECSASECNNLPFSAFQTKIVSSFAADAITSPFGDHAMLSTHPACWSKTNCGARLLTSHTRTV